MYEKKMFSLRLVDLSLNITEVIVKTLFILSKKLTTAQVK